LRLDGEAVRVAQRHTGNRALSLPSQTGDGIAGRGSPEKDEVARGQRGAAGQADDPRPRAAPALGGGGEQRDGVVPDGGPVVRDDQRGRRLAGAGEVEEALPGRLGASDRGDEKQGHRDGGTWDRWKSHGGSLG